jgi:hypothetical protein
VMLVEVLLKAAAAGQMMDHIFVMSMHSVYAYACLAHLLSQAQCACCDGAAGSLAHLGTLEWLAACCGSRCSDSLVPDAGQRPRRCCKPRLLPSIGRSSLAAAAAATPRHLLPLSAARHTFSRPQATCSSALGAPGVTL